jgi:hypothetical protein
VWADVSRPRLRHVLVGMHFECPSTFSDQDKRLYDFQRCDPFMLLIFVATLSRSRSVTRPLGRTAAAVSTCIYS